MDYENFFEKFVKTSDPASYMLNVWFLNVSWPWELMQNLKKNWFVVSKLTRSSWNLTRALKSLQNLPFHLFLLCKRFNVWPKKVQRSYLLWHVSKLELWWDHLIQSMNLSMSLKEKVWAWNLQASYLSRQSRLMQNLKRNWLAVSKLTWTFWSSFTQALESLKNFHFSALPLRKGYIAWARKVNMSYLSW